MFLDFHLNDKLKSAIIEAKEVYQKIIKSLDIDYLIFNKIGKNMCKKQGVSPDAVMQLGFQVMLLIPLSILLSITSGEIVALLNLNWKFSKSIYSQPENLYLSFFLSKISF